MFGILYGIFLTPNINGYLYGYEKLEEDYDPKYFTEMSNGTIDDIEKYPEKYSLYWIDMKFENITDHYIYNLNAKLSKKYSNVWLSDPFTGGGFPEFPFDLTEREASDWGVSIVIKTEQMNETDIDKLIRGIGITIHAQNTELPVFASNRIFFK